MSQLEKVEPAVNRPPRQQPATTIKVICQLAAPGAQGTSVVLQLFDISRTGMRVISPFGLPLGKHVDLRLIGEGKQMELQPQARVVWSTPRADGSHWVGMKLDTPLSEPELNGLTRGGGPVVDEEEHHTIRWTGEPDKLVSRTTGQACLVRIYPTGPDMGKRHFLGKSPLLLGRDQDCALCLNDQAVSRRHARIVPADNGFMLLDLQSTNGTYVNNQSVQQRRLQDGDYVQVGSSIFRFLVGGNVEADYHEELYRMTISDALTNIANKRYLLEFLDRELARSRRYSRALSLIMFDVDRFKSVNDKHGHLAGDFTLRELANRVRDCVRKEELFARYGGEEFTLVLPETPLQRAVQSAERIRALVAGCPFSFDDSTIEITISAGVVSTAGEEWLSTDELLRRADEKLYQAKDAGRNRVVA